MPGGSCRELSFTIVVSGCRGDISKGKTARSGLTDGLFSQGGKGRVRINSQQNVVYPGGNRALGICVGTPPLAVGLEDKVHLVCMKVGEETASHVMLR